MLHYMPFSLILGLGCKTYEYIIAHIPFQLDAFKRQTAFDPKNLGHKKMGQSRALNYSLYWPEREISDGFGLIENFYTQKHAPTQTHTQFACRAKV